MSEGAKRVESKEVQQFSKQHQEVANQISNLTARINQLVSNNQIQTQIEDVIVTIHKKSDAQRARQSASNINVEHLPKRHDINHP